jgi:hypothetical protein
MISFAPTHKVMTSAAEISSTNCVNLIEDFYGIVTADTGVEKVDRSDTKRTRKLLYVAVSVGASEQIVPSTSIVAAVRDGITQCDVFQRLRLRPGDGHGDEGSGSAVQRILEAACSNEI